jgi:hypothetical protein
MAFENEKTPPFNLWRFLSPKNRRKWLCGKGLRRVMIANGVPKHKIFFGMIFAHEKNLKKKHLYTVDDSRKVCIMTI